MRTKFKFFGNKGKQRVASKSSVREGNFKVQRRNIDHDSTVSKRIRSDWSRMCEEWDICLSKNSDLELPTYIYTHISKKWALDIYKTLYIYVTYSYK